MNVSDSIANISSSSDSETDLSFSSDSAVSLGLFNSYVVKASKGKDTTEIMQQLDESVDEQHEKAFLDLAKSYASAFGNPTSEISGWKEALEGLTRTVTHIDTKKINLTKFDVLKDNLEKLDNMIAKTHFSFVRACLLGNEKFEMAYAQVENGKFSDGYPKLMSLLGEEASLKEMVVLQRTSKAKKELEGEGQFSFPSGIERICPNLRTIDMSRLWIKYVSPSVKAFTNLTNLNLSDNSIRAIPAEVGSLKKLRRLNLADNFIAKLPNELSQCDQLEKVNLSRNPIDHIPESIGVLAEQGKLKTVDMRDTKYDPNSPESVALYAKLTDLGVKVKTGEKNQLQKEKALEKWEEQKKEQLKALVREHEASKPFADDEPAWKKEEEGVGYDGLLGQLRRMQAMGLGGMPMGGLPRMHAMGLGGLPPMGGEDDGDDCTIM